MSNIAFVGLPGSGLGFGLAGIEVREVEEASLLNKELKSLKETSSYDIIFVDEGLAADDLETVRVLNEDTVPAIVLLPNTANPKNVAADNISQLVTRAVGSDILSDK